MATFQKLSGASDLPRTSLPPTTGCLFGRGQQQALAKMNAGAPPSLIVS
jgi:hypothetical protein